MIKQVKLLFKKYPILTILGSIVILIIGGYIILVLSIIRPVNMMMGRNNSYDKSWGEVEANMGMIKVGTPIDSVKILLGEPDSKYNGIDGSRVLSYQQYSVIAAHWVYDIHIKDDSVIRIESYDW